MKRKNMITKTLESHLKLKRVNLKNTSEIKKKKNYVTLLEILTGVSGLAVGLPLSLTGVGSAVEVSSA